MTSITQSENMIDNRNLLYLLFIPLFAGCNSSNTSDSDSNEYPKSLTETWEIESFIDPQAEDVREMQTYSSNEVQQKHINATHIIWLRYEKDTGQLLEMGGGTYQYEGSTYIEHVELFSPPSSSALG